MTAGTMRTVAIASRDLHPDTLRVLRDRDQTLCELPDDVLMDTFAAQRMSLHLRGLDAEDAIRSALLVTHLGRLFVRVVAVVAYCRRKGDGEAAT